MVPTAIITSPIAAHHCDYPSSHRQIIIVIMIIAMIIMLIQIVIVTIMPMIIGGGSIILAEIMRGRSDGGAVGVIGFACVPSFICPIIFYMIEIESQQQ